VVLPLSGGAQDVWVLPDGDAPSEPSHAVNTPSPALERLASDLPSRSVENLYWLGRYTERLEQLLRVCRSIAACLVDESSQGRASALAGLLERLDLVTEASSPDAERDFLLTHLLALLFDEDRPSGVRPLLKRIHAASFSVRDRLSADTWRILNRLGPDAGERPLHLPLIFARAALNALVFDLAAFSGMEMENMTRGHGWVFLDLGRRIERGIGITRLVAAALRGDASRGLLLEPLLEMADSVITYRRRYFAEPRLAGVLELLLLESANPRALAFQLAVLQRHAASLPAGPNPEGVTEMRERFAQLAAGLDDLRTEGWEAADDAEDTARRLGEMAVEMGRLSDLLTHVYFSQVLPRVS